MKNKASVFLKQIISALSSLIKGKSLALKSKTNAMKARLIIFSLLRNKKVLFPGISHKLHALLRHAKQHIGSDGVEEEVGDPNKAIVVYNAMMNEAPLNTCQTLSVVDDDDNVNDNDGDEDEDGYPDLTHSLFDELEFDDGQGSVIDLVRNNREDGGSDFNLEDEIDHVADVFIRRFHKQMQMQKQNSFKRYKEMLDRSL